MTEHERLVEKAVTEYVQRKARIAHPDGKTDNAGRWYPSGVEIRECCTTIREPSRRYPWSLMVHCRTMQHVAHIYGLDGADIRKALRSATAKEA